MFTAWYALRLYIKQTRFVFKEFRNIQCWLFIMSTGCEDSSLQGRYAKSTGKQLQMFRRDVLPSPSILGLLGTVEEGSTFLRIMCNFQLVRDELLPTRLNINKTDARNSNRDMSVFCLMYELKCSLDYNFDDFQSSDL